MSEGRKAQSTNAAALPATKLDSRLPPTKKFRAAGQPAGHTSTSMLGDNRFSPNPNETSTDPFAPLPHFPDKHKMDGDERSSSVSDNDDSIQLNEKPKPAPGKKTRGRVKIQMEYIQNKLRRYTTFSKRKSGIMKKAYELSTLTGTQVMLLVASETGHVYTFATPKLQPMITSEAGKALIQTCLHQPDQPVPPTIVPTTSGEYDIRMSAAGYEETDLGYNVPEEDFKGNLDVQVLPSTSAAQMPTVLNPGPVMTIPHGMMMPFQTPVSMPEPMSSQALNSVMTPVVHMHPTVQQVSPQSLSPHHSPPPPSYSSPHQPSSPPRTTFAATSYPGSPSYTQSSHMTHPPVIMDELGSPLGHHPIDTYDRSPSRSPIQHRYSSPHHANTHSPQALYTAPHGSPPMAGHSPAMRL